MPPPGADEESDIGVSQQAETGPGQHKVQPLQQVSLGSGALAREPVARSFVRHFALCRSLPSRPSDDDNALFYISFSSVDALPHMLIDKTGTT